MTLKSQKVHINTFDTKSSYGFHFLAKQTDLNLDVCLQSGQTFSWIFIASKRMWCKYYRDEVGKSEMLWILRDRDGQVEFLSTTEDSSHLRAVLSSYFRLDYDLNSLYKDWSERDLHFKSQCNVSHLIGTRLLDQPAFEVLLSFICSQNNAIPRITSMVQYLQNFYGSPISIFIPNDAFDSSDQIGGRNKNKDSKAYIEPELNFAPCEKNNNHNLENIYNTQGCDPFKTNVTKDRDNEQHQMSDPEITCNVVTSDDIEKEEKIILYAFPTPEQLYNKIENLPAMLRKAGFGYRSEYIAEATRRVYEGTTDLKTLRSNTYEETWKDLMEITGVGPKVADCVALSGLGFLNAIPVDTHILRLAKTRYGGFSVNLNMALNHSRYQAVGNGFRKLFGPLAGWAQLLLFRSQIDAKSTGTTRSKRRKTA